MNDQQKVLFDILCEYALICERHNLRYFLFGGTCLGAVRHKGFIPWDDDIDVAMPRDDFEKFMIIAKDELPKHLSLLDGYSSKHYGIIPAKLHDIRTTQIEERGAAFTDRYCGVAIDIMPLDGTPETEKERIAFHKKLRRLANFSIIHSLKVKKRGIKALFNIYFAIAGLIFPPDYYFQKYVKAASKYEFTHSDYILHAHGVMNKNINLSIIPRKCFEEWIMCDFEGVKFRIPKEYDKYLSHYYGADYMTPPPEDKRVLHDIALVDLTRSYLYYVKAKGGSL